MTFHNGEVLDAEIVKLNWDENIRLRQPHWPGIFELHTGVAAWKFSIRTRSGFVFPEPDGGALAKLSIMHIANRQFYREVAGARSAGELSRALARGARAHISWWKGFPPLISGRTGSSWKPIGTTGMPPIAALQRIIFDNTLEQHEAVELVKKGEGRVELVTGPSPLETLRVAQSPFAKVVKKRGSLHSVWPVQHAENGEPMARCAAAPGGEFCHQPRGSHPLCHQRQWGDYPGAAPGPGVQA